MSHSVFAIIISAIPQSSDGLKIGLYPRLGNMSHAYYPEIASSACTTNRKQTASLPTRTLPSK